MHIIIVVFLFVFKLLYDSEDIRILGKWRISFRFLTFGTLELLNDLCSSNRLFLDGAFKSYPESFAQLYSVHVHSTISNNTVSVLYSFLPNKTKNMYKWLDFEQGAINALKQVFPGAIFITISSCFGNFMNLVYKLITIIHYLMIRQVPGDYSSKLQH